MYPCGAPGLGLLLLRLTVAMQLMGALRATNPGQPALWQMLTLGLVELLLCAGALTPFVSLLCFLFGLVCLGAGTLDSIFMSAVAVMTALALMLAGPGAYSADAKWFGRRLLVVRADTAGNDF
jgi:uncharacterized membrane protein YphA (DoxX/SURF4 family)